MDKEIKDTKNPKKLDAEDDFDDPILHEKPTSFSDFVDKMTNRKKKKPNKTS